MKVIFVCTGNTCRSPMAEAYAKSIMPNISFSSRGLFAYEGMPMSENARLALENAGISAENHISKNLTEDDIATADLILTMSANHKKYIEPYAPERVFTLKEYALGEGGDIADPFGGDEETYIKTLNEITDCINALKERLE